MIPINFNTTHRGFFKNTTNWQQLCRNIMMERYVADYKNQTEDFFIQRLLIQFLMLQGNNLKIHQFKKIPFDKLINENISLSILDYLSKNDFDLFRFNVATNIMLTIIKNKSSIVELLQKDANSYAFNKQLLLEIPTKENQNKLIKI